MFIIGCRQIRAAVSATHDHRRIARGGSNTIRSSSSLNMSPVCACKPGARGPFVQGTSHRPFPAMACGRNPSARVVAAYAGLCALQSARWQPREQYVCKRTAWHRPAGAPHKLLASPYNAHPAAAAAAQPARSAPSRLEDKLRGTSNHSQPRMRPYIGIVIITTASFGNTLHKYLSEKWSSKRSMTRYAAPVRRIRASAHTEPGTRNQRAPSRRTCTEEHYRQLRSYSLERHAGGALDHAANTGELVDPTERPIN